MTAFHIIDTDNNAGHALGALKARGIDTVIRYIAYGLEGDEKVIKPAEAREFAAAGMKLGIVYEIDGRPGSAFVGGRDGAYAARYMPTIGMPEGSTIWYTVDYDPSVGEMDGIISAFQAFKNALNGKYKLGCYGSGMCCQDLKHRGLIDGGRWLTDSSGFDGTRAAIDNGWYEMRQLLPQTVCGLDADPDLLLDETVDIGAAIPNLAPPAPPDNVWPPDDPIAVMWWQSELNKLGANLAVDGDYGAGTTAATKAFQMAHHLEVDGEAGPATVAAMKGLA